MLRQSTALPQADDSPVIEMSVPPNRVRWLCSQLDAAGLPYEMDAAGNLRTLDAAQPIIDQVLGYQSPRPGQFGGGGLDLLRRQPQNRSRATDAAGFVGSLLVVGTIVVQSSRVAAWAGDMGLNPDVTRGWVILVAGLAVTYFVSEIVIGRGDSRRWLFVLGMLGLFVAAAWWFLAHGMGVL
jgi:hypothetical protein